MTISHDSFAFYTNGLGGHVGRVTQIGAPEFRVKVGRFFGVVGEVHLFDGAKGQNYGCKFDLVEFATLPLLEDAISTVAAKVGSLVGTLTETVSGQAYNYTYMTFIGIEVQSKQQDGATGYWWAKCNLFWRKRQIN